VASPDYLAVRGVPGEPADLVHHSCLRFRRSTGAIATWLFNTGDKPLEVAVLGPLIAHDYSTLVGAAERGLGLAQVPAPLAAPAIAAGRLEPVLVDIAAMTPGRFLYHVGRRQVLPKLRALIDHLTVATAQRASQ
jgi:DNA-binding transcriptional LysR family regulator